MNAPEEPGLHGAFAQQLRALQASGATQAEIAWAGPRLLALQQEYTRDLDTMGFGDAGREAFINAYCADAPDNHERRSEATVLWHTSILPEQVFSGVIPAPPHDLIIETIRQAHHTAGAYTAARNEYADAWVQEDIPDALNTLRRTYDAALIAWGEALHTAPDHIAQHLSMPNPHPDVTLTSEDPLRRLADAIPDLSHEGPHSDPDRTILDTVTVGEANYARVLNELYRETELWVLRDGEWSHLFDESSGLLEAAYERLTGPDAPTDPKDQYLAETEFADQENNRRQALGRHIHAAEVDGIRYAEGPPPPYVEDERRHLAMLKAEKDEREYRANRDDLAVLIPVAVAPHIVERTRAELAQLDEDLAAGTLQGPHHEYRREMLAYELDVISAPAALTEQQLAERDRLRGLIADYEQRQQAEAADRERFDSFRHDLYDENLTVEYLTEHDFAPAHDEPVLELPNSARTPEPDEHSAGWELDL